MLFGAASLGPLQLKNRLVKSAAAEGTATEAGLPSHGTRVLYERWARGGVGLIVTGLTYVNKAGQCSLVQHGAHVDSMVPAWREITQMVHEHGAKIGMQLMHGGRQVDPRIPDADRPLAPSAVPNFVYFTVPRAMSDAQIRQTIRDFGESAARAKDAGFDAVQIHAAHGYLISGFLSPMTNRRNDEWGGDPERRSRFLLEVYRAVRAAVGADFPVLCKLNVNDFIWTGLRPKYSFDVARTLASEGLDGLELSGGIYETLLCGMRGGAPVARFSQGRSPLAKLFLRAAFAAQRHRTRFEEMYFLPYAQQLRPTLGIPLIMVGGVRDPQAAERVLAGGHADFISMCRPLIRQPDLPSRWLKGSNERALCISCNNCLAEVSQGNPLACYAQPPS